MSELGAIDSSVPPLSFMRGNSEVQPILEPQHHPTLPKPSSSLTYLFRPHLPHLGEGARPIKFPSTSTLPRPHLLPVTHGKQGMSRPPQTAAVHLALVQVTVGADAVRRSGSREMSCGEAKRPSLSGGEIHARLGHQSVLCPPNPASPRAALKALLPSPGSVPLPESG